MPRAKKTLTPEELEVKRRKQCEAQARYRLRHPATEEDRQKRSEWGKKYRKENKEMVSAKSKIKREKTRAACAAREKAWRERNKEKQRAYWKKYNAENAERNTQRNRKNYLANQERLLAEKREYYQQNREEVRARNKNHEHRRRAQKRGCVSSATATQVRDFLKAAKHCHYCRSPFTAGLRPTLDHVIPLIRGGPHSLDNFAAACRSCNSRKGTRDPYDFARRLGLLLI